MPACQNFNTLVKLLICRCTAPAVAETARLRVSPRLHLLGVHVCMRVRTQMHRYSSLGRLSQNGTGRNAQKGNERSYLSDILKELACGKKKENKKQIKETVEAMHQTHHNIFKGLTE